MINNFSESTNNNFLTYCQHKLNKKEQLIRICEAAAGSKSNAQVLFALLKKASKQYDFYAVAETAYKCHVDIVHASKHKKSLGDKGKFWCTADQILKLDYVKFTSRKSIYRAYSSFEGLGLLKRQKCIKPRDRTELPWWYKDTVNWLDIDYVKIFEAAKLKLPSLNFINFLNLIRPNVSKYFYATKLFLRKFVKKTYDIIDSVTGKVFKSCPMKERKLLSSLTEKKKKEVNFENLKKFSEKDDVDFDYEVNPRLSNYYDLLPSGVPIKKEIYKPRSYNFTSKAEEVSFSQEELKNPLYRRLLKLQESLTSVADPPT